MCNYVAQNNAFTLREKPWLCVGGGGCVGPGIVKLACQVYITFTGSVCNGCQALLNCAPSFIMYDIV